MNDDVSRKITCNKCGIPKDIEDFRNVLDRRYGKWNRRLACRRCDSLHVINYRKNHPAFEAFQSTRRNAKKKGHVFELTRSDVDLMISSPCSYCGATKKIGIDRRENSLGYTLANSVPCCGRCNMLKRDMPLGAWEILVPSVKKAYESGAFGSWTGHNFSKPQV